MSKCLYCNKSFSGGQTLRRRFSTLLGQYRNKEGIPIPLKYLKDSSNRWFHEDCVYPSLNQRPDDADPPNDEESPEQSPDDNDAIENWSDEEEDAAQNLWLLGSPAISLNPHLSARLRRATVPLAPLGEPQYQRVPSTLQRTNTKYDYFSIACAFRIVLIRATVPF